MNGSRSGSGKGARKASGGAARRVARRAGPRNGPLLLRLAARRFDADTAEALAGLLEGVDDADRLAEVGEMIVDCRTGGDLLDRAGRA